MRARDTTVSPTTAPSPDRPTDVLVVGAGLAGLPVAWELARRGATVRIVDRGEPGAGTSRVAAGMLAPVLETEPDDPEHLAVGRAGLGRWPAFAAALAGESGIDVALHEAGTLAIARDRDEAEALVRFQAVCARFGLPVERVLPSAARRLEPALAPTLRGALSVPGDLAVDPRVVTAALVRAANARGVAFVRGAVARLLVDGDLGEGGEGASGAGRAGRSPDAVARHAPRATGVELADGTVLRAGDVVLATGAHPVPGVPVSARVPVRPVKGQLLVLRDPTGPGLVARVLRFGAGYLVPRDDGRYVLGATTEERGFDVATTAWALHDLLRDGAELVPGILDLEVEETLAGLRPTTPDALPAIGPAAGVEGLWWATGHHRNGVLLAPLTGELVADALGGRSGPTGPEAEARSAPIPSLARLRSLVAPERFTRSSRAPWPATTGAGDPDPSATRGPAAAADPSTTPEPHRA